MGKSSHIIWHILTIPHAYIQHLCEGVQLLSAQMILHDARDENTQKVK